MNTPTYIDAPEADKALRVIAGWGSTADEIATTLIRLDVKGHPDCPDDCVIFHGLRKAGIPVTAVYPSYIVHREGRPPEHVAGYIEFEGEPVDEEELFVPAVLPLPAPLDDLAHRFDAHEFPELEEAA